MSVFDMAVKPLEMSTSHIGVLEYASLLCSAFQFLLMCTLEGSQLMAQILGFLLSTCESQIAFPAASAVCEHLRIVLTETDQSFSALSNRNVPKESLF